MDKKKKSKAKGKAAKAPPPPAPPAHDGEKENPFQFGGLPARDLKKNLGCG